MAPSEKNQHEDGRSHLPTPSLSPDNAKARAEADRLRQHKQAAEQVNDGSTAEVELKRVLECRSPDPKMDDKAKMHTYATILNVAADAPELDKENAWKRLGKLLHPKWCSLDKSQVEKAFQNLENAATELGVDQRWIDAVKQWDGEADLDAEDSDDDSDDDDANLPMEDDVPPPPPRVMKIYDTATPLFKEFMRKPRNATVQKKLLSLEAEIENGNAVHNQETDEHSQIRSDQWNFPVSFFKPNFKIASKICADLRKDPSNEKLVKEFNATKDLIDAHISRAHLPAEWAIPNLDAYLKSTEKPTEAETQKPSEAETQKPSEAETQKPSEAETQRPSETETKATNATAPSVAHMKYPWPTLPAADGLIVGVRKHGGFGTQVCVERVEDGRLIRRLQPASVVGLRTVDIYKNMDGHKVLSDGQSSWSYRDRGKFVELLWVTRAQGGTKNKACGKKDPPADCCVKFKTGIETLTISSLRRVLGTADANKEITEVCDRDRIPTPSNAGYRCEINDPSRLKKTDAQPQAATARHRRTRGHPRSAGTDAEQPASEIEEAPGDGDENDERLSNLEETMESMAERMSKLESMIAVLVERSAPTSQ